VKIKFRRSCSIEDYEKPYHLSQPTCSRQYPEEIKEIRIRELRILGLLRVK